jgi:hypothetical protein
MVRLTQMRAHRLEEAHHLPLIIDRPAPDDALAARAIDQTRLERRAVPQRQRVGRLHIVMPIEQHMRRAGTGGVMRGDHAGQARGLGQAGGEPHAGQLGHRPVRRPPAIARMGRLRADAGNAQPFEQALHPGLDPRIHPRQHIVDHRSSPALPF